MTPKAAYQYENNQKKINAYTNSIKEILGRAQQYPLSTDVTAEIKALRDTAPADKKLINLALQEGMSLLQQCKHGGMGKGCSDCHPELKSEEEKAKHHTRHTELHAAVGELFWDFLKNNPGQKMTTTMFEFLSWSAKQVDAGPDHENFKVVMRRGD